MTATAASCGKPGQKLYNVHGEREWNSQILTHEVSAYNADFTCLSFLFQRWNGDKFYQKVYCRNRATNTFTEVNDSC